MIMEMKLGSSLGNLGTNLAEMRFMFKLSAKMR